MISFGKALFSVALASSVVAAWAGDKSGPQPGESVFAFEPTHVTGPDAGTQTCPVCKYGIQPAVQVWVNSDSLDNVGLIASQLESEIAKRGLPKLRAFVVYMNPKRLAADQVAHELASLAAKRHLKSVALTYLSGPGDGAVAEYHIAPSVKNTVVVYSNLIVVANFVDLKADKSGLSALSHAADKACRM